MKKENVVEGSRRKKLWLSGTLALCVVFIYIPSFAQFPPVPSYVSAIRVDHALVDESAYFYVWTDDQALYMRVAPITQKVWICSLGLEVTQGSYQENFLRLDTENGDLFCGDLYQATTFKIHCFGVVCFDPSQNLTLEMAFFGLNHTFYVRPRIDPNPAPLSRSGWWWNANENGRGVNLEIQGSTLFMAFYAYDQITGEPCWFTSGGIMAGQNSYSGDLIKWTDGQCLGCSYVAPISTKIGTISLIFSDDTHASITSSYQNLSIQIERFRFGTN
jgi:hypothetical protein